MLPVVSLALQMAQFAPSLLKLFGSSEPTVKTAEKVVNIATAVTAASTPEVALDILQGNSKAALEFRIKVNEQELELQKLQNADTADARSRDVSIVEKLGANSRANWLCWMAMGIIVLILFFLWSQPDLNEYTKGVITTILGVFLQQIATIYNFEFGYTRGKAKMDDAIQALSKKNGEGQ